MLGIKITILIYRCRLVVMFHCHVAWPAPTNMNPVSSCKLHHLFRACFLFYVVLFFQVYKHVLTFFYFKICGFNKCVAEKCCSFCWRDLRNTCCLIVFSDKWIMMQTTKRNNQLILCYDVFDFKTFVTLSIFGEFYIHTCIHTYIIRVIMPSHIRNRATVHYKCQNIAYIDM